MTSHAVDQPTRAARPATGPAWLRAHGADLAFAGVLVLAAVIVMLEMRGLSFFADEWDFVLDRPGLSGHSLLSPHGPHLVLIPVLVYKVLLSVFGGNSYIPFRALAAFDLVLMATTLGVLARRRWGPWWALAPMVLLVCVGPAGSAVLSPFEVCYTLAVVAGIWTLMALSTRGLRADVVASLSLLVSLASCSQGVGFAVGAAVMIAIRREWRRAWVVLVPVLLYLIWYAADGHQHSETQLSLWTTSLTFTLNGTASTIAGMFALSGVAANGLLDPTLGLPITFGAIALLCVALARGWMPTPFFWGALVTFLVLWVLASLSNTAAVPRYFNDPRYLSSNGILLLAVLVAAIPVPRLPRAGVIAVALGVVVVAATNVSQYAPAHHALYKAEVVTRAETGSLLVMRGHVPANFSPSFSGDPGVSFPIQAGPFFRAVAAHGVISDSVAQLRRQSEPTRAIVDGVLERGELRGLDPTVSAARPGGRAPALIAGQAGATGACRVLGSGTATLEATPGTYRFKASPSASLSVIAGRFATTATASLGQVAAGRTASLLVPADHAPGVQWKLLVQGAGARICRLS